MQDRQLYAARDIEFLLNLAELLIPLQGTVGGNVAQRSQKKRKTKWFKAKKLKLESASFYLDVL